MSANAAPSAPSPPNPAKPVSASMAGRVWTAGRHDAWPTLASQKASEVMQDAIDAMSETQAPSGSVTKTTCQACSSYGWLLADADATGKLAIQRCDECEQFGSDEAAVRHVDRLARAWEQAAAFSRQPGLKAARALQSENGRRLLAREEFLSQEEIGELIERETGAGHLLHERDNALQALEALYRVVSNHCAVPDLDYAAVANAAAILDGASLPNERWGAVVSKQAGGPS